jgi:ABC-type polar amino acid transport system ATPase subunit
LYPKVGVVFQNLALWPHLTLRENILLPLKLLERASNLNYVAALIEAFEMSGFVDRLPRQASGGEKQRAALVRALALRPTYVLLDEITSALDVEQVSVVLRQLENLKREGIGILLVTHLIGFARRAADKFVFLSNGQMLEAGTIDQLNRPQHERLRMFLQHVIGAS